MSNPRLTLASHYTLQVLCALILCLTVATIPACASTGDRNYFPLADGARWEYTGRFISAAGRQFPVRATIRVDGTTLIRGRRYFKYITSADFMGAPDAPTKFEQVRYYRTEAGGIYFLPGDDLDGAERLAIPLPVPVGDRWLSGPVEVTAEGTATIEAGGRKYDDCLKLTYNQPRNPRTNEEYYAPGVGLIKFVYINTAPPQSTIELSLEKYKL